MKHKCLVTAFVLTLSCSPWVSHSQSGPRIGPSPVASSDAATRKVKVKDGKLIDRDKSKPVRRAIEA